MKVGMLPPVHSFTVLNGARASERDDIQRMIYQELLNSFCYRKLAVTAEARLITTENSPPGVILGTPDFLMWHIVDAANHGIEICHDPKALEINAWWSAVRGNLPFVPQLRGCIVVMKCERAIPWSPEELMINISGWLAWKYGNGRPHKFSGLQDKTQYGQQPRQHTIVDRAAVPRRVSSRRKP